MSSIERKPAGKAVDRRSVMAGAVAGAVAAAVPLRLATYTGLCVSLVTLLALVGYLIGSILFRRDWPAGFATLVDKARAALKTKTGAAAS